MAFVLEDMHKTGAALDYPVAVWVHCRRARGGVQRDCNSKVHLRQTVVDRDMERIDGKRVKGITLANGKVIPSSRWRHLQPYGRPLI
jgi:hypothetical protein